MAVTAFNSDTMREAGINNANDLAIMTPSLLSLSISSPFQTKLQIRGIGTSQSDPALEPSVGVFVDDVFPGCSGLGIPNLTHIERIEVLQGPPGYAVGQKHQRRHDPCNNQKAKGTAGDYGMGNLTPSDTVAWRLSDQLGYSVKKGR